MMPFFTRLRESLGSVKSALFGRLRSSILRKYPEIDQLVYIVDTMKRKYHEECIATGIADDLDGDGLIDDDDDDRWVPLLLTLGLIYKVQKNDAKSWYNHSSSFLNDSDMKEELLQTFGYFWHLLVSISKAMRTSSPDCSMIERLKDVVENAEENVLFSHSTDQEHLGDHCPDFALTAMKSHRLIILTICGTRMIPAPEMKDVFMDLYADSEPFLHGHAHRGMAMGCYNILEKVLPSIHQALSNDFRGFDLVISGYSLGAGISQLVTMELTEGESAHLIPEGTQIRCLTYGTPPVFKSDKMEDYKNPNVFSVYYNNDGLISASITNVLKLFMQIRALEHMDMRRRDMWRLLFTKTEDIDLRDGDDSEIDVNEEDDDDTDSQAGDTENKLKSSWWLKVRESLDKVEHVGDFIHLEHPSKIFIFKRKHDVITRIFQDTNPFSQSLRLRGSMFNDHMPWGYNALFDGYGLSSDMVKIEALAVP